MPRTTLDIDGVVLQALKQRQVGQKKSLGEIASQLLAKALADEAATASQAPLQWTSKALGLKIDLSDKEALWAALDGRDRTGGALSGPGGRSSQQSWGEAP